MGRIWMPGGGGGADLDAVTAGAGNVEAGKVIVGPDGEPISGAVPNLSQNPDAQYATGNGTPVIKGDAAFMQVNTDNVNRALIRYDGASERGKAIIQPNTLIGVPVADMATAGGLTAAKLAQGQSAFGVVGNYKGLGDAGQADVRSGRTFSTAALSNASGTMPEQGGSTITPRSYAQTAVAANRYVTGNVTVAGDGNLVAANIKKNVTIFGVKGTWEGYVADTNELFDNGVNAAGFTLNNGAIQDGAIRLSKTNSASPTFHILTARNSYPFGNYAYLNIDFHAPQLQYGSNIGNTISLRSSSNPSTILASYNYTQYIPAGRRTFQLNISDIGSVFIPLIYIDRSYTWSSDCYIYRIWLS